MADPKEPDEPAPRSREEEENRRPLAKFLHEIERELDDDEKE